MGLTEITDLMADVKYISSRTFNLSYNGCKSFEDARKIMQGEVESIAPKNARFFQIEGRGPNRPAGMGVLGPLYFDYSVRFYG